MILENNEAKRKQVSFNKKLKQNELFSSQLMIKRKYLLLGESVEMQEILVEGFEALLSEKLKEEENEKIIGDGEEDGEENKEM